MNMFSRLANLSAYLVHICKLTFYFLLRSVGRLSEGASRTFGFIVYSPLTLFNWLGFHWSQQTGRQLLQCVPASIGIAFALSLFAIAAQQDTTLSSTYVDEARSAMRKKDFVAAELMLTRVLRSDDARATGAEFEMALLLDQKGDKQRAAQLFASLAPDDRRGFTEAHRRLAAILGERISPNSSQAELKRLFWHLTAASDKTTPQMEVTWGRYYIACGDLQSAKESFSKAVDAFPALWKALGALELETGNPAAAEQCFKKSSEYLSARLKVEPGRNRIRMDLAEVLMLRGDLDEAERVVEAGRILTPDGPWNRLLASLAVSNHDSLSVRGATLSELLGYLNRALVYDPNYAPALNRLMAYSTASVDENEDLKSVLAGVIAKGERPALAHVALGNLCWLEGNQEEAIFHFESAMGIRNDIAVLLNNLAWLLAHREENPEIDRAIALINLSLQQAPNNADFLDTRGSILMLKQNWKAAVIDLEKALGEIKDSQSIHRKLAIVYTNLGYDHIAAQHEKLTQ